MQKCIEEHNFTKLDFMQQQTALVENENELKSYIYFQNNLHQIKRH